MLQNPVYILADNNGSGNSTDVVWTPSASNPNYKASAATFTTYGYKATITTPSDNFAMCSPLGDTYTAGDLEQQLNEMSEALLNTYFEPGGRGINIWRVDPKTGKGKRFSENNAGGLISDKTIVNYQIANQEWQDVGNPLAWAIYENDGNNDYPFAYHEELANLFTAEGASACGDPETWLNEVHRLYPTIQARTEIPMSKRTPKQVVVGTFADGNGMTVADRFRYITWSTNDTIVSVTEDPYIKALSSRLGLVAMDTVIALAALEYKNNVGIETAEEMANKIYAWITSDYDLDNMAMIMVESTSGINANGNTSGTCDFLTLLDHIALSYGSHEILLGVWPEDCWGDTNKAFTWSTNGAMLPNGWRGPFAQGIWGYPNGGEFVNDTVNGYYNGRGYLKTLNPHWAEKNVYGYFLNWT